jgi:hypothetical protein
VLAFLPGRSSGITGPDADDLGSQPGHGPRLAPEHDGDISRVRADQEERLSGGSCISQPGHLPRAAVQRRGVRGGETPAVHHAACKNARTTFPPSAGNQSREAAMRPTIIRPRPASSSAAAIVRTGGSAN